MGEFRCSLFDVRCLEIPTSEHRNTSIEHRPTQTSKRSPLENTLLSETLTFSKASVLADYELARMSRECSLLVRKEVFSGHAKFGIYGDGKEICQIALARAMRAGDFISGYYRDQTIVAAVGDMTWTQYFSQLYGHPDIAFDPHTGGRTMNNHHATR